MKKVTHILFNGLLYFAAGVLVSWVVFHGRPLPAPVHAGYELFCKAHSGITGIPMKSGDFTAAAEAAAELAQLKDSELWTVLLLLDVNNADYVLTHMRASEPEAVTAETEFRIRTDIERREKGIIAEVLKNIPENAHKAVLWAVTAKLLDTGRGMRCFTDESGPVPIVKTDGSTEPIQEIALETLKRCLGVDYGYDPFSWRQAMLKTRYYYTHVQGRDVARRKRMK
jgi:hypothetical protein